MASYEQFASGLQAFPAVQVALHTIVEGYRQVLAWLESAGIP